MATRIYLPSSGTAPITSVGFSADWEDSGSGVRLKCSATKASTAMTTISFTDNNAANRDCLLRQYVFDQQLEGQVIASQTVKFQIRAAEALVAGNMFTAIGIRVATPTGAIRGTILSVTRDDVEMALVGSLTNRQFTATTSAVTSQDGDYLVLEVGGGGDPGAGGDHDYDLSIGDDNATDLPENDTETAANNPWIEFPDNIAVYVPKAEWMTVDRFILDQSTRKSILAY